MQKALASAESAKLAAQADGWARLRAIVAAETAGRRAQRLGSPGFGSGAQQPQQTREAAPPFKSYSPCLSGMSFKGRPMGAGASQPRAPAPPPRAESREPRAPPPPRAERAHAVLGALADLDA